MKPILTCKQGTNADLFPDILRLYVPEQSKILDMTYGRGVFWKNTPPVYYVMANDIDPERGIIHQDFRKTTWPDGTFDAVVLDPPYIFGAGGKIKNSYTAGYKNNELKYGDWKGIGAIINLYQQGMSEALRVLRPGGILIVKCMDLISSGKQHWIHIDLTTSGEKMEAEVLDMFVLLQNGTPVMRFQHQVHARKNHSYFLVFRKPNASVPRGKSRGRKSDLPDRPTPDTDPDNPTPPTRRISDKTSPARPTKAGRTSKSRR